MYAAEKGSMEIVKLLLDGGADANAMNKDKESVLMHACEKGHTAVVELLVKAGAGVKHTDKVKIC